VLYGCGGGGGGLRLTSIFKFVEGCMTTIAANREMLAGDRKVTHGSDSHYYAKKIFVVGKDIVGMAGMSKYCSAFLAWYKNPERETKKYPKINEDHFDALILTFDGRLLLYAADEHPDDLDNDYYAIGTGCHAAMAFMSIGLSPEEAVQRTREIDNSTGGRVDVLHRLKSDE
jgi:hypothetical protein